MARGGLCKHVMVVTIVLFFVKCIFSFSHPPCMFSGSDGGRPQVPPEASGNIRGTFCEHSPGGGGGNNIWKGINDLTI